VSQHTGCMGQAACSLMWHLRNNHTAQHTRVGKPGAMICRINHQVTSQPRSTIGYTEVNTLCGQKLPCALACFPASALVRRNWYCPWHKHWTPNTWHVDSEHVARGITTASTTSESRVLAESPTRQLIVRAVNRPSRHGSLHNTCVVTQAIAYGNLATDTADLSLCCSAALPLAHCTRAIYQNPSHITTHAPSQQPNRVGIRLEGAQKTHTLKHACTYVCICSFQGGSGVIHNCHRSGGTCLALSRCTTATHDTMTSKMYVHTIMMLLN
jgi:hypothetical protein